MIKENGETKIVDTNEGLKDGQNKCPHCGGTDISFDIDAGVLRCQTCRKDLQPEKVKGLEDDLSQLEGYVIGLGAQDIDSETQEIMTLKCTSCGAEVVIDTKETVQARCHWCRNTLSLNRQIPNGAIPDMVLPFKVKKEESEGEIEKFVKKRNFFAHPEFKKEFTTQNIMGVYLPYMVIDVNGHSVLKGQGEHLVRRYTSGDKDNQRTYYDADLYNVKREFDLTIEGLTVESSMDKLRHQPSSKTNNILNSIMPFDIENAVRWDANYLRGYTSEKRDINIDQLKKIVEIQTQDIARHKANETLKTYDRGVKWSSESLNVKGEQWQAAYLPVWLYSYQQIKMNGDKILHYVAVNARTKETMGSIPLHMPKLLLFSLIVEFCGIACVFWMESDYRFLLLLVGFLYFFVNYGNYRNSGARHAHEIETTTVMFNCQNQDELVKRMTRLSNSHMKGANNTKKLSQAEKDKLVVSDN